MPLSAAQGFAARMKDSECGSSASRGRRGGGHKVGEWEPSDYRRRHSGVVVRTWHKGTNSFAKGCLGMYDL